MRPVLLSIFSLLLAAALPGAAPAQSVEPTEPAAVEASAPGVEPAADAGELAPRPRSMRPYWHVFAAFGLTWVLLLGYALWLGRRFGRLEAEVKRLGGAVE